MAGSKKGRQSYKNKSSGKYRVQFLSTVKKTGRWRGKRYDYEEVLKKI